MRTYSSYKSLFRIRYAISRIGDFSLPREIPLDAIIVFAVAYFPLYPVSLLLTNFLYPGHPHLVNLFVTGLFSWWASKWDPQGKPLPVFIADIVIFALRYKNKRLSGERIFFSSRKKPLKVECWEVET